MPSLTGRQMAPLAVRLTDHVLTRDSVCDVVRLPDEREQHHVLLDLSGVCMPTAGGLGALVGLHKQVRDHGGRLVLLNVQPWAYEVFAVTRLTELMDVRAA
jgi:anti-anti-sigma factor